jgi:hypothetical protein
VIRIILGLLLVFDCDLVLEREAEYIAVHF